MELKRPPIVLYLSLSSNAHIFSLIYDKAELHPFHLTCCLTSIPLLGSNLLNHLSAT